LTAHPTDPIGIFDSGVGGLSIAAAIRSTLSAEHLLYYADTARFPYGSRSEAEVRDLAVAAAGLLIERGTKLVVVACNTASSAALAALRARYPVPFVGVVPGVKPGAQGRPSARVAVLATQATFASTVFNDLVAQFGRGAAIRNRVCPELVALVEAGEVASPRVERLLHRYIDPLVAEGIDTLVLGCTHYAFMRPAIERVAGAGVRVIDTADAVARQVQRVLAERALTNPGPGEGGVSFQSSGDLRAFLAVVERLWPESIKVAP